MAFKTFALDEQVSITIYKRRGSRSLRLSVSPSGQVRVTIPGWAPYSAGLSFARARKDWIVTQAGTSTEPLLRSGQAIGKGHHLQFVQRLDSKQPAARVRAGEVTVFYPLNLQPTDKTVQASARKAAIRALRQQAEALLPKRLITLTMQHHFLYHSVSVKQLSGRWGSCDAKHNIVFNLFLLQLPWDLIDYVILHELTHTQYLNHSPAFWGRLEQVCPDYKVRRSRLKKHKPVVLTLDTI